MQLENLNNDKLRYVTRMPRIPTPYARYINLHARVELILVATPGINVGCHGRGNDVRFDTFTNFTYATAHVHLNFKFGNVVFPLISSVPPEKSKEYFFVPINLGEMEHCRPFKQQTRKKTKPEVETGQILDPRGQKSSRRCFPGIR